MAGVLFCVSTGESDQVCGVTVILAEANLPPPPLYPPQSRSVPPSCLSLRTGFPSWTKSSVRSGAATSGTSKRLAGVEEEEVSGG